MTGCRDALAALEEHGLPAWHGLPSGCAPAELAPAVADLDPAPGMANLGMRKALFRFGTLTGSGAAVQVWTTTDEAEVLMLAVERPSFAPTGRTVVAALGPPPERLDNARGAMQWVYAKRGVALFVDLETDAMARAALFRPCTPAEYDDEFRVRQLERPLRRRAPQ